MNDTSPNVSPDASPKKSPWWHRNVHADRKPFLAARGRIRSAFRAWFEGRDFTEVEAGIVQVSPGNEAHLHAFATTHTGPDGQHHPRYLHTSPEFACKKLLAAGETRIFDFARVFRNKERGALHAPEFTLLEWYRAGEPYGTLMEDCAALVRLAASTAGCTQFVWRDRVADPFGPPERLTVAEAFLRFANIDLVATLAAPSGEGPDRDLLARQAQAQGIRIALDDTWSDIFSRILSERVEPELGLGAPTFLTDYPVIEAALARPMGHDPRFAERFELYVCGVELANAFGELTDAGEQRRRFEAEMREKSRVYGETYPLDEEFLAALAQMPQASGCALGFDRLVMLATGARHIDQVLWTPLPSSS